MRHFVLPTLASLLAAQLLLQPASAQTAAGGPPPAVTTAVVNAGSVAPEAEFVGRVEAVASFDARPRVEGTLQQVAFQEGQDIAEGQLLYTIEPAPYEAQLTAAQAQLAQAEARLREAEQAAARAEALRGRGTVSEAALEEAEAARASTAAEVLAARAQVQQAELSLSYTRISSPIAGRIGATAVTAGNLVNPQSGVLATVVRMDPIRVTFPVSDRQVLMVMQQSGARTPSELTDRFIPRLKLADGQPYPHPGKVEFIDNRVDPATGTLMVRALFPNPDRLLIPGQYAMVTVRPQQVAERPLVPVSAVQRDREGTYVLVLGPGNVPQIRRIALGTQAGQVYAVEQGLRAGETIIVEGQQKVRPGAPVTPVPATADVPEASPSTPVAGPGPQGPPDPLGGNAEAVDPPENPPGSGEAGGGQPGGGTGPGSGGAGGTGSGGGQG